MRICTCRGAKRNAERSPAAAKKHAPTTHCSLGASTRRGRYECVESWIAPPPGVGGRRGSAETSKSMLARGQVAAPQQQRLRGRPPRCEAGAHVWKQRGCLHEGHLVAGAQQSLECVAQSVANPIVCAGAAS